MSFEDRFDLRTRLLARALVGIPVNFPIETGLVAPPPVPPAPLVPRVPPSGPDGVSPGANPGVSGPTAPGGGFGPRSSTSGGIDSSVGDPTSALGQATLHGASLLGSFAIPGLLGALVGQLADTANPNDKASLLGDAIGLDLSLGLTGPRGAATTASQVATAANRSVSLEDTANARRALHAINNPTLDPKAARLARVKAAAGHGPNTSPAFGGKVGVGLDPPNPRANLTNTARVEKAVATNTANAAKGKPGTTDGGQGTGGLGGSTGGLGGMGAIGGANANPTGTGAVGVSVGAQFGGKGPGAGGGGGGGKIICTELFHQGCLDHATYRADQLFGSRQNRTTMEGYWLWGRPVVRLMKRSPTFTRIVRFLAKPWAKAIAKRAGYGNGSLVGEACIRIFVPVCFALGSVRKNRAAMYGLGKRLLGGKSRRPLLGAKPC